MKRKKIVKIGLLSLCTYLVVCFLITAFGAVHMVIQNKYSRDIESGKNRVEVLKERNVQVEHNIYTEQEIEEDATKGTTKLFYVPSDNQTSNKYVILLPGGAYSEADPYKVAMPTAVLLNNEGYNCFVLEYRTKNNIEEKYAPLEDVARAITYINSNKTTFNVDSDNYMIVGFSAGGHLAGLWGSKDMGYTKYNLDKPKTVCLVYPWSSLGGNVCINGNVVDTLVDSVAQSIGVKNFMGHNKYSNEEAKNLALQYHIDEDYPDTYIMQGKADFLVKYYVHSNVLTKALKEKDVYVKESLKDGVNHGVGIGLNTSAEGWIKEALEVFKR